MKLCQSYGAATTKSRSDSHLNSAECLSFRLFGREVGRQISIEIDRIGAFDLGLAL
jgi:hypothetical protein